MESTVSPTVKKNTRDLIAYIAKKHEINSISEKLDALKEEHIKVKVAFLGEFSAGKSTLVNALMKKNFLPSFDKPTTAIVTEIEKGYEYKFEISESNGEEVVVRSISPADLAEEVQRTGNGRVLKIKVSDSDLIDEDTILIDTPGVSSINESHSDVTYGYMPMVDVAFLVVNINMGSISKSLEDFINQYPKEVKDKIYFVLNFSDTKSPEQRVKLVEEFSKSVAAIVDKPRIFEVSSLNAIKANRDNNLDLYGKSGIAQIEKVIREEIPAMKKEIQSKRVSEKLKEFGKSLIGALEEKLQSVNLDDDSSYERIKELRSEIEKIEKNEKSYINSIKKYEQAAIDAAYEISDGYVDILIEKFTNKKDYSELVAEMLLEVNDSLRNNLPDLENIDVAEVGEKEVIRAVNDISKGIAEKFKQGQQFSQLAMSGLLTVISPARGAWSIAEYLGAELLQTNKLKNGNKISDSTRPLSMGQKTLNFGKRTLGVVSKLVQDLNLFEKGANFYNEKQQTGPLKSELRKKANMIVSNTFKNINKAVNDFVKEEYKNPLSVKIEALNSLRNEKRQKDAQVAEITQAVNKDIYQLKAI